MRKLTLLACLFTSSLTISFADTPWKASISRNTAFVENKGQVMDQHNRENKEVRFMYVDGLFNLQLRKTGFSYELFTIDEKKASFPESGFADNEDKAFRNFVDDQSTMRCHRIDVTLVGANPAAEITGEEATGIIYNFYTDRTGTQGATGVASFEKVKYKNIYPGIDLVFFAPDQSADSFLKYEWIVHPGADASKIKLQYDGAISFLPDADGGFKLYAASGIINESKVIAFRADDRSSVPAQYQFNHNTVTYKIKRDKENTIVIDPNILWSSYYGGELSEDVNNGELAVDKQSKVIIVGSTFSNMYIATNGAFQTSFAGGYHDAIIAKFTTAGKLSWATYYGASGKDEGHAITTDNDNNIFIAGLTTSQTVISTPGAFQTQLGGYSDAFVVKFNANGIRLWGTYLGGSIQDEILGMDCDKNGNLYFTGYTVSPDHIATPGAHQDTMNNPGGNNGDAFLGAFSPGGNLRWCSYFSGPAQDRAHGICVGKNSDLFIEGTAESTTQFSTAGVHQSVFAGGPTD
ncbi:MAG: SBBP repeat-containing protein, partial [Chitinophagales bacterium]|nr:SBBP repeat-containing protein [Chitinophagales bacterium]